MPSKPCLVYVQFNTVMPSLKQLLAKGSQSIILALDIVNINCLALLVQHSACNSGQHSVRKKNDQTWNFTYTKQFLTNGSRSTCKQYTTFAVFWALLVHRINIVNQEKKLSKCLNLR